MMKKNLFIIVFLLLSTIAFSKCRRIAEVKFLTERGWSQKYEVAVTFMSGMELNEASDTYRYISTAQYAIISWGSERYTLIRLNTFIYCEFDISCDCIDTVVKDLRGYDNDGSLWNICVTGYCY